MTPRASRSRVPHAREVLSREASFAQHRGRFFSAGAVHLPSQGGLLNATWCALESSSDDAVGGARGCLR